MRIILAVMLFLTVLLTNNSYAKHYSLQSLTSKDTRSALNSKNRYLYRSNGMPFKVEKSVLKSLNASGMSVQKYKIKNRIVTHINNKNILTESIIKKDCNRCKLLEKELTPCRNVECNKNEHFPWEINFSSIKVSPKVPDMQPYYERVVHNKKVEKKSFFYNNILRFYIDLYGKYIIGQQPEKEDRIKDSKFIGKLGLQYSCDFLNNFHFYTDDRVALSYEDYRNNVYNGLYFDINELYVNSFNLYYNMFNFVMGRKRIKDYNSLFYNSPLDLIGLYNAHDLLLYKIYFGTRFNNFKIKDDENTFGVDTKSIKFLILETNYQYYFEHYINFLYQYENSDNTDMFEKRKGNWISIRTYNTDYNNNSDKFFYYGNIALLNGKKNHSSNNIGYELFAGLMYEPDIWINKGIGISFAHASSDYFQPYISNNKSDFLSKNLSFRYFGEFLDPELSNINILSSYLKYNQNINSVYMFSIHKYWKNIKNKDIYVSENVLSTNNKSKDVGEEADLLYKYIKKYRYYWEFSLSYFHGGDAFNNAEKKDGVGAKIYFRYYW